MRHTIHCFLLAACMVGSFIPSAEAVEVSATVSTELPAIPDRRKAQFTKDYGYALFPYPYSLPGIGSGLGLVGGAMNNADTYTDVYGIVFTGDVRGEAFGIGDIHIIPRTLILDVGYSGLSEATIQSYSQRGMNTDKNDYRLLELGDTEYYGGRMTATFFDRRFEVYGAWYQGASKLKSIRDKDGTVIVEAQNAPRQSGHVTIFGSRLDLTDDYSDPRRGIRFDVTRSQSPPNDSGPDFYVMDYNTTAYIPIGRRSTWAFNFLRSEAVVLRTGATTTADLNLGLDCSTITDPQQRQFCDEVIHNMIENNKYGTATQLGGFSRLRAYPQGRFQGAHTVFYGTELRWNLTDERTPFNIFVMKDIRTSVQVAAFYEIGVTSDVQSDLTKRSNMRDDYGLGLRVITASGVVFRGDIGFGKEGVTPEIFIGYPWELQ